ncbi:MAG TPA: hypothetical protein VH302_07010 [Bryobacteraceae bacterium]|nr:hypothetical protein [Bryobacteraceae bacterium]
MARSQNTNSALDELRHIQHEARRATSLDEVRSFFDRIQAIRYARPDDFDTQLLLSEVQEEVINRARTLRDEPVTASSRRHEVPPEDVAEIPHEVPRVDPKTVRWALYLAAIFTAAILAAFFYLIQTARKINLTPNEVAGMQGNAASAPEDKSNPSATNNPTPVAPLNPTLRLYTDLIPGTVTIDDNPPQDLKDGELVLDNLQPGQHSIKVTGHSGNAAFTFDVSQKSAPRVIGLPTASNAMAVLVSEQDGSGHLITNADHSTVYLDGEPAGEVGTDGLQLTGLGTVDHNLQVTQDDDRQRFVMTYTRAPVLTVYVKSDFPGGMVVVKTGLDNVAVAINGKPYKRETDHGQLRIPLRVGTYTISVHKPGFIDPPSASVEVKKAEEAAVEFKLDPAPQVASLEVKGALPGTMIYVDRAFAAAVGADGNATVPNVPPGDHAVELRRDQALPKRFDRVFRTGDVVMVTGADATLEKVVTEAKPPVPAPGEQPSGPAPSTPPPAAGVGHYSFQAQAHVGGLFKHNKLQWYAGFQDSENYVLFTLDGKHAIVRDVRDGKSSEVSKTPFNLESNQWVQIDIAVKPNMIDAKAKTPDGEWTDIGSVTSPGRDFTRGRVGVFKQGEQ